MRKVLFITLSAVIFGLFSGCAFQRQPAPVEPLCLPNTADIQAMEAAQTVLVRMHFDIEKYDTDARYIRTRPLSGSQFFEIWRRDNVSGASAAQANLHSLRRIVELELSPQGTMTCIQCRVGVLRLSVPEQPIEGYGRMAGVYTESSYHYQTLEVDRGTQAKIEWLDAGRDHDLESRILELIQTEMKKGTSE